MTADLLTLEPLRPTGPPEPFRLSVGQAVAGLPVGSFQAVPLGDGPSAGAKLTGKNSWLGVGCGLAMIAFFTGVIAVVLGGLLADAPIFGPWAPRAVLGLGGTAFVAVLGWALLVKMAADPGEAAVSPWPLTPGTTAEVRFAQRLKKGLALRELRAELTCVESARYRVGTDTRTETRERFQRTLPPVDLLRKQEAYEPARQAVTAAWEVAIPADLPPSLDTTNSDVNWTLIVILAIDRYPDAKSTFALKVI